MTVSAPSASISAQDKGFFGHPRGLSTLFFTELWERFSFYGMKAILGLYLWTAVAEGGLGVDKALALSVVAIYGTAVYMSGVAGGWLAFNMFWPHDWPLDTRVLAAMNGVPAGNWSGRPMPGGRRTRSS